MTITINPNQRRYLSRQVRSGKFKSESDVVQFALQMLQKNQRDLVWLKREVQKGIDSANRGESTPWDVEHEKARLLQRIRRSQKKG